MHPQSGCSGAGLPEGSKTGPWKSAAPVTLDGRRAVSGVMFG